MTVDTVGFAAFLITIAYTAFGLPAQIKSNYRRKSVEGLSKTMNWLLLFTFVSWVIYGSLKSDWYIVGSNAPGAVCTAIILGQFRLYGERAGAA